MTTSARPPMLYDYYGFPMRHTKYNTLRQESRRSLPA